MVRGMISAKVRGGLCATGGLREGLRLEALHLPVHEQLDHPEVLCKDGIRTPVRAGGINYGWIIPL